MAHDLILNLLMLFAYLVYDGSCHFRRIEVGSKGSWLNWILHSRYFKEFVQYTLLLDARQKFFVAIRCNLRTSTNKR